MAWRVDEAVEHGLIDNTVEGHTTGKIWLVGRDEPQPAQSTEDLPNN